MLRINLKNKQENILKNNLSQILNNLLNKANHDCYQTKITMAETDRFKSFPREWWHESLNLMMHICLLVGGFSSDSLLYYVEWKSWSHHFYAASSARWEGKHPLLFSYKSEESRSLNLLNFKFIFLKIIDSNFTNLILEIYIIINFNIYIYIYIYIYCFSLYKHFFLSK